MSSRRNSAYWPYPRSPGSDHLRLYGHGTFIHHWTTLAPLAAAALLVLTTAIDEQPWLLEGCVAAIIAAVLAAVHYAEVIAHRVGEPLGTLVLALAVTVIEAALLLSLLFAGGAGMETLPRDTVYATVMIITHHEGHT